MVKIPRRSPDPWLRPIDVIDGDKTEIITGAYVQEADKNRFRKERTVIGVTNQRTQKNYRWALNNTSNDRCVEAFGCDGDLWVGNQVIVEKVLQKVSGADKYVLYARPMAKENLRELAQ